MRSVEAWKRKQLKDSELKAAYDALEEEFARAGELIGARAKARLSQAEVARRMGVPLSTVIRMEGGRLPSTSSLVKYAKAVGRRVEIRLTKAG